MEVLILGWWVLTATDSPVALAILGALRYGGTVSSPLIGAFADRLSRKSILVAMRLAFAVLAAIVTALSLGDALAPWHVFVVVTLGGLMRPADMMLRQSLVADTVPRELLTHAMSFVRIALDSARLAGALLGATLMALLGMGWAYLLVTLFYLCSTVLSLGICEPARAGAPGATRTLRELGEALVVAMHSIDIRAILVLAFLVNLTVLSITGGLLPLVARDVYGLDSTGLGLMVATFAGGGVLGSVATSAFARRVAPERLMLAATLAWHALMMVFAQVSSPDLGVPLLGLIGVLSSLSMVPMSSSLLLAIPSEYRARIMGLRQLAVFGLPLGLLASGPLIERAGIAATFTAYGVLGLIATAAIWLLWARAQAGGRLA